MIGPGLEPGTLTKVSRAEDPEAKTTVFGKTRFPKEQIQGRTDMASRKTLAPA